MAARAKAEGVGILLAGGASTRMGGGDKCLLPLGGRPLLRHVIERLRPQVEALVINANEDPVRFAQFGLPAIPDLIGGRQDRSPACMPGSRGHAPITLKRASSSPPPPTRRFSQAIWWIGSWQHWEAANPARGGELRARVASGVRAVACRACVRARRFASARRAKGQRLGHGARCRRSLLPGGEGRRPQARPVFNLNRPEDFAEAEALLAQEARRDAGG